MAVPDKTAGPSSCLPLGRVENLSRTYSRLRDLACLPKDLMLYLARHECGTKICREKGIEYDRRQTDSHCPTPRESPFQRYSRWGGIKGRVQQYFTALQRANTFSACNSLVASSGIDLLRLVPVGRCGSCAGN